MTYTLAMYKDRTQQWRWRLTARNGRIVADAGESYKRKIDCVRMAMRLFAHLSPDVTER